MKDQKSLLQLQEENENLRLRLSETERELDCKSKALEELEKKSSHFIKFAPTAIYEIDFRSKKIVTANDAMVSLSGYSREELLSIKLSDFLDKESFSAFQSRLEKMSKGENLTDQVEYRVKAKDGHIIYALLNIKFNLDDHGMPVGALVVAHDITERKTAEQEKQTMLDRFRLATEATHSMVYELDTQSMQIKAMHGLRELLGYEISDTNLTLDWWDSNIEPEDLSICKSAFQEIKNQRHRTSIQYRVRHKNGKTIFVEDNATAVSDDDGNLIRIVGTVIDITERKLAEDRITLLSKLMDHNPSLAFLKDESGRYVYLNKSYEQHFALTKDWYGKTDFDFWPRESAELFRANDSEILRSREVRQFIEESTDKKGTRYSWLAHKFSFNDSNNKSYVGGIGINITERVRAEEALAAAHTQIQGIIDNATSIIYAFDLEERFILANAALAKVLNTTPGQLIGKRRHEFMPKADADWHEANDRQAIEAGKALEFEEASELQGRSIKWLTTKFPLRDAQGKIYALAGISADITERKQAEEALERERMQLLAIIESLDEAVGVWNTDGSLLLINDATAKLYGFEQKEQMLKNLSDYADVQVRTMDGRELPQEEWPPSRVLRGETFSNWELEQYIPSINKRFIGSNSGRPVRDANGNIILGVTSVLDITERKQAEEALKQSENRFYQIFNTSPNAISVSRFADGLILDVNEAYLRLFGFNREEVIAHKSSELGIFNFANEAERSKWLGLITQGKIHNYEMSYRTKAGSLLQVLLSTEILTLDNTDYILATITDITERKMMEEALRENDERLRHIARTGRIGFVEYNIVKDTGYWSREHHEIFGFEPGSHISHELWLQGVHPEDKDRVMANYAQLLDRVRSEGHVEGHRDEYRFIRREGDTVWIESDISVDIVRGEPIIRGSVRDITEQKRAELALDGYREKLNMALENANVGLWEWNLKTREFIIDEKIERMFGLAPGIFGNTYPDFEKLINEEDVAHFQKVIKRSIDNHSQLETIFRINPGNGKTKYYSARALLNTDNEGRVCGFTGVCFDITGMKESTDQLVLKLNEELLRSNKDLQQFAYVASHDLQEPLRMVTSFTQLLAQRYEDKLDKEAHEFINFAVDGAKRMHNLINALLSYSRVQTRGKEFARLDMTVLLNRAIENLSVVIKETRAIITYDKLPFISGDEEQISQLLQNLIGNALKFNNKIPKIHIGFKEDDSNNVFSVKDNGIGIEQQYFERIFIIFQRLVGKDEYNGTGIGLAICKSIVERHGGRIWVESKFGKGSTFYFTIPKNFN